MRRRSWNLPTRWRRHRPCSTTSGPRCRRRVFPAMVGRISFFVNAGIRFVTEMCKMRAFSELWDEICRETLRGRESEVPALPLRRPGQLARPDGAAARKQRLSHPAGNACGHAVAERPRPGGAAAGLERGARTAASPGTSNGRCACSRSWHTRRTSWSSATCSTAIRSSRRRSRSLRTAPGTSLPTSTPRVAPSRR